MIRALGRRLAAQRAAYWCCRSPPTHLETTRVARFMRASVRRRWSRGTSSRRARKACRARDHHGHVVRNSILPVITVMGYVRHAMGGAVLLETVFLYPVWDP